MVDVQTADSTGRVPSQAAKASTGVFLYNRDDMSFMEMQAKKRFKEDLFAVFQDEYGHARVQYARIEDYAEAALEQMHAAVSDQFTPGMADYLKLIGCIMISRSHNYSIYGFVNLLDHDLNQIFDLNELINWINERPEFFRSPAEAAVLEDAHLSADLQREYDEMGS